ncbi:MAG: ATP-binding protein, partial [Candidatus Thermoplasmatota archaeon]|nr:ATP-binding protein [Candidatus Thermoplasmatota archaeon]
KGDYLYMNKELLYRYNPWWEGEFKFPGVKRTSYLKELDEKLSTRRLVFVYGLRRCGKTTIMKQFVAEKLKDTDASNIFFISVDHPAISEMSLLNVVDEYRSIFRIGREQQAYILFDEVHAREGFEKELKVLYDLEPNLFIIATGSNSLIIKHRSGHLVGRNARMNVDPLNFHEYIQFRSLDINPSEGYLLGQYIEDFMVTGGMPEYVLTDDPQYIEDVVEDIIYKDIVPRCNIQTPVLMKKMFYLICQRAGRRLTASKLSRVLGLSRETVTNYLNLFQEAFLIDIVLKEGTPNERIYSPKKVYVCDNGILSIISGGIAKGALAENLMYLALRKKGEVTYLEQGGKEVDFLVKGTAYEIKYLDSIVDNDIKNIKAVKSRKVKKRIMVARKPQKSIDGIDVIGMADLLGVQ